MITIKLRTYVFEIDCKSLWKFYIPILKYSNMAFK